MPRMEPIELEVADIFIVLQQECAEKFDEAVVALIELGMEIASTDSDDGVVEGTLRTDRLAAVKNWKCIKEVRIDFIHIAGHPVEDEDGEDER